MWTDFVWLRINTGDRLMKRLSAFQIRLYYMELVVKFTGGVEKNHVAFYQEHR